MSNKNQVADATYKYVEFLINESEKVQKFLDISSVSKSDELDSSIKYQSYKEKEIICKLKQKHKEFLNDETNNIPHFLKIMFEFVGDPDLRISFERFSFNSLNEIMNNADTIPNIIDIGSQYAGMGHFIALTINKLNKKLFFRREGGSNGYEQYGYYNYYVQYCTEDINRFEHYFKTMDEIIKIISEKKIDFCDENMIYIPDEKDLSTIIRNYHID